MEKRKDVHYFRRKIRAMPIARTSPLLVKWRKYEGGGL